MSDVLHAVIDVTYVVSDVLHEVSDVLHVVSDVLYEVNDVFHVVIDVAHAVSDVFHYCFIGNRRYKDPASAALVLCNLPTLLLSLPNG